jgi:hypothetical protein
MGALMTQEPDESGFVFCSKCGKRLIRKTKSGRFHFIFGKTKDWKRRLLKFTLKEKSG